MLIMSNLRTRLIIHLERNKFDLKHKESQGEGCRTWDGENQGRNAKQGYHHSLIPLGLLEPPIARGRTEIKKKGGGYNIGDNAEGKEGCTHRCQLLICSQRGTTIPKMTAEDKS